MSTRTRRDRDDGYAEVALATPLMLVLLGAVVQVALYAYASHVAQSIAHHGLAAARAWEATEDDGRAGAEQAAAQLQGDLLQDLDISVERTEATATVQITAAVPTFLPGLEWPVEHTVSAPVERPAP
ncbi:MULTISPECIES: TadE/TadG family type IV pilus assembly protein [Nocardiopsis]|uniref:Flp pilus assembly protein TadG n=2 Tax=Nocardiopsis TaxID=2013 RepID=A0A840WNR8_9ACTN|nr:MULTISPECIES: TadE/TadG family type IV pilus assembly protein [Nocardiopsis]MBB5493425.1 Flp pilus assembly protein TadG [Nocardiopsis metallicus]MCK9873041.1 pilus assembly protein [Nocardiopsis dassonvillei]MEE2051637.1 TadE/TadG family type IV pilus assembly protein [Nocardiopsis umidischolae]